MACGPEWRSVGGAVLGLSPRRQGEGPSDRPRHAVLSEAARRTGDANWGTWVRAEGREQAWASCDFGTALDT